jgi:hypothetical protein
MQDQISILNAILSELMSTGTTQTALLNDIADNTASTKDTLSAVLFGGASLTVHNDGTFFP